MHSEQEQTQILNHQMSQKRLPDNILHENMIFMFEDQNTCKDLILVQLSGKWKIKYSRTGIADLYIETIIGKYSFTDTYAYKWIHESYLRTIHDEDFIPFLYEEKEYVNDCYPRRPRTNNPKPNSRNRKIETSSDSLGIFSGTYEALRKLFS